MFKTFAISVAIALALMSPATAEDVLQTAEAPASAGQVPQAVKDACAGDYEKHCKKHDPESTAAHDCMAHAFETLSDPCVTAILDSPLVEEAQQQVANARESEAPKATAAKRKAHKANAATRTAKAKHAAGSQNSAGKYSVSQSSASKTTRRFAQRQKGPRRSVTAHIRRGTGIASRYVAKYTRFAFAKAFR